MTPSTPAVSSVSASGRRRYRHGERAAAGPLNYGVLLACPLMIGMMLSMGGHGGTHGTGRYDASSDAAANDARPDTTATGESALVRSRARAVWEGLLAALGVLLGLAPHVLHHVGFLAGTALVAGSGGTALFGAVGFVASIPMLLKLRRRFGTWRAPAIGLAVFAAMFTLSAFVLGPAFTDATSSEPTAPAVEQPSEEHDSHHS